MRIGFALLPTTGAWRYRTIRNELASGCLVAMEVTDSVSVIDSDEMLRQWATRVSVIKSEKLPINHSDSFSPHNCRQSHSCLRARLCEGTAKLLEGWHALTLCYLPEICQKKKRAEFTLEICGYESPSRLNFCHSSRFDGARLDWHR